MAKNWKSYAKKQVGRAWRAGKRFVKKRYLRKGGLQNVMKDVAMLKSVINSEKLRYTIASSATSPIGVGQIAANAPGYYVADITPALTQGDGYNNRTGSSVKLHSANLRFLFTQQASTLSPLKFKIQIYKVVGNTNTTLGAVSEIFSANPFTGMIDYNSTRNPDYFKDYKLVKTAYASIPLDPASLTAQKGLKEMRFGLKFKSHHLRWDKNTSVLTNGQLIMVVFCNSGNSSGTAPTITPYTSSTVPVQDINSGGLMNYYIDHFYYDN